MKREAVFITDAAPVVASHLPWLPKWAIARVLQVAGIGLETPMVALPLISEDQSIGIMTVWGETLRPDDAHTFSIFASQVAASLEMARLHQTLSVRWVEEQEILLKLSRSLVKMTDYQAVISAVLQSVQEALQVEIVSLMTPNAERTHLILAGGIGWDSAMIERYRVDIALSREGFVFRNGAVVQQTDVSSGQPFPCPTELAALGVAHSLLRARQPLRLFDASLRRDHPTAYDLI